MSSSAPGTAFGRYRLIELLAVGGMAEVFVARTQLALRRCRGERGRLDGWRLLRRVLVSHAVAAECHSRSRHRRGGVASRSHRRGCARVRQQAFREPLRQFYKDRVAELLLAKNPIIGALSAEQRRELIVNAEVRTFDDGAFVVREGEDATELFVILAGEVEVSRVEHGVPVFINKLQDGQVFGEMAVLQQRPRAASVQAMGAVDVLCFARADIEALLAAADDVRALFDRAMASRAAESAERVRETTRIFAGV